MRWWQISNSPPHRRSRTQPQRRRSGPPIGPENKTKQKKETQSGSEVSVSCPRLFACHLLDMIITTEQGRRRLSWAHLYQQAGIKLSNYPPRPPGWALDYPRWAGPICQPGFQPNSAGWCMKAHPNDSPLSIPGLCNCSGKLVHFMWHRSKSIARRSWRGLTE